MYFLQVRGRSNFSTVGEWSEPEVLTLRRVPPPTNIRLKNNAPIRGVTRIQSGNNLMISGLTIPLMWMPPSNFTAINGYEVVVSLNGIDQLYADPTTDFVSTTVRMHTYP